MEAYPPGVSKGRTRVLAWLERNQFLVLGLTGLLLLAGLLLRDLTKDAPPALVLHEAEQTEGAVVVHVAGAVAAPGLYELPAGARVQDALIAAGGAMPEAEVDAINLARRLRDGERVMVPAVSAEVAGAVATLAPGEKLDLNDATVEQLDRLPGIGEVYSQGIADSRVVDGPYMTIEDLRTRNVIPPATFEQIKDHVTVTAP
jgi:competence protein ComEA